MSGAVHAHEERDTPIGPTPTRTPTTSRSPAFAPTVSHLPILEALSLSSLDRGGILDTPTTPQQSFPSNAAAHQINPGTFPPEIISLIVQHLYYSIIPPPEPFPAPDPYLHLLPREASYLAPRFAPALPDQARETLRSLALVDKTWGEEATRALWRKVSFAMPRGWECVLRVVAEYAGGKRIKRSERVDLSSSGCSIRTMGGMVESPVEQRGRADWSEENKWRAMAGVGRPEGRMLNSGEPEEDTPMAEPTLDSLQDLPSLNATDSPLLQTKTISFSRFRTAGMNRSVRQGSHERFVTAHRLLTLLRGTRLGKGPLIFRGAGDDEEDSIMGDVHDDDEEDLLEVRPRQRGKLEGVAFTEFMDSAISKNVLDELLFRGGYLAEYEEPDEPNHMDLSDSDTAPSPFPSPFHSHVPLPPAEPFHARHLQSSHSRSPIGHRRHSLSSSVAEESEGEYDDDDGDDEHSEASQPRGRPPLSRFPLQRRSSGSAFAPPSFTRDESEERGRERVGRDHQPTAYAARGRPRFNRSLVPPVAFTNRSSSVPAPYLSRPVENHPRGVSLDTERSSSVPASTSGRRGRGAVRIVQVLEGSTEVRPIRALDLCGCVSKAFVGALEEVIGTYRLGPPTLLPAATSSITAISEYDSEEEHEFESNGAASTKSGWSHAGDDKRKLRRTFFPHLRRLGLASSLLPSPLLTSFVLSFPYLTHLDLASTLTSPLLLKHLALAGQNGPGGRKMRLKALSLARCRLMTGAAIVGLLCGDCPPFTSHAGMEADEQWGSGEVVADLIDLSLFGDGTYPSPLSLAELRLVISISPAFTSGHLRTLDLSSTPLTDAFLLDDFPPQPHLVELGLANCRGITLRGVATFLETKAPGVEILDLSNSAPAAPAVLGNLASASRARRSTTTQPALSIMELHTVLLRRVASVDTSSYDPDEATVLLALRSTNLRVVELDEKALEAVQGGAGDWRPIWGKGRRGWYVDVGTYSALDPSPPPFARSPRKLVHLPRDHPRRQALQRLYEQNGSVTSEVGWRARKMEVVRGDGMMGHEEGLFAFHAYQV